ncbi:MAG TPA: hypothetical protein VLE02_02680 [Nitrosarchaeum sp.]|nr:hypothetical protein [Nitrosarchaeum sp.]
MSHTPKFYGKDSDADTIRKHIVELLIGNPEKSINPLSVTEIAKRLSLSRETIYQYRNKAIELGEVVLEDGKIKVNQQMKDNENFSTFCEAHQITEDETIKSWISSSRTMGHTGKGVKSMKSHIQNIQRICNELKITPIQLTIDLKTSEQYAQSYYDGLVDGTIKRLSFRKKSSPLGAFYPVRQAIRHLMQYNGRNGISIPRGYKGILQGRIVGHGNYADIDATDKELQQIENYIIEKYGLDSDIYRIVFVGIESCARKEALLNMALEWTEDIDEEDGELTFFMSVVETKTEHIAEGKLDKFVSRKNTQESLRLAKARGQKFLWDSEKMSKTKAYETLTAQLKEIYTMLGKTNHYFFEHPFHTLRHLGAHYHLRATEYNYGYVAVIGGWTVIDELKASYGKMPPHILKRLMKKSSRGFNNVV